MNYKWNHSELELLKEFLGIRNELFSCHIDEITQESISRLLYLEAILLVRNKYVVGYLSDIALGVYSFNEVLQLEESLAKNGQVLVFHPLIKETLVN